MSSTPPPPGPDLDEPLSPALEAGDAASGAQVGSADADADVGHSPVAPPSESTELPADHSPVLLADEPPGSVNAPPNEPAAPPLTDPSVEPQPTSVRVPAIAADPARKRDRAIGLAIVVVAFAATLGLSFWAKVESEPVLSKPPAPPTTEGIKGWPKRVEPLATLEAARAATPRDRLRGIVMEGVAPDGTVDMTNKSSRIRYAFQSKPGEGPQPPRERGTLPTRPYCGKQSVHIRSNGLQADPDVASYPCGRKLADALPEPRCTAAHVWKYAIKKGAKKKGKQRARIEYFRSKAGPAWRFTLPGTKHRFTLYGDCVRELKGSQARGHVP